MTGPSADELYEALTELQSSAAAYVQGLETENRALREALEAFDPDKDFDGAVLERYGKLRRAALKDKP